MSRERKDKRHNLRPRSTHDGRGAQGLWLYGQHAVMAAVENPERKIRRLLMTAEMRESLEVWLAARNERKLPQPQIVSRADIDPVLPSGAVHQGIACQTEPLDAPDLGDILDRLERNEKAILVILDQVTDPHNVGAILRSAAAFGASAVIVPDRHAPEETGVLAKSASGALERMPLVRVVNLARALDEIREAGFWTAGLAADGPQTLAEAKLSGKIALVLGSEGEGLRRLTREKCDHLLRLPMSDAVESLNVSNAAAVALYELAR